MKCPICKVELSICAGTQLDPKDGVTVYCANRACAAEISGHGGTVKEAEKIVSQRKLKSEQNEE